MDYPILSDPSKKVARAYGVVNDQRKVPFRWTFYISDDGTILHIDKKVNPASHGEDITKKLKALNISPRPS